MSETAEGGGGGPRVDYKVKVKSKGSGSSSSDLKSGGGHGVGGDDATLGGEEGEDWVGHALSDQHILYNDIFAKYNKHLMPVLSHEDIIEVHFEIALFNVLSLVRFWVIKGKRDGKNID